MAEIARLVGKRRMQELPHQFRRRRLVRIVATGAVRSSEGLIVMRLLQARVLRVMAVETERGGGLGQMEIELGLACFSRLVGEVAGLASQIERGMTAAFFRDVQSLCVALETEILSLVSRLRFQQLILVVASVGVVTLNAVAHCRRMHCPVKGRRVLFRVATQAEGLRSRSDQLDAGHIFIDSNFVAAQAARRDRRMDRLALGLILVALETLRRINILVERNRMLFCEYRYEREQKKKCEQLEEAGKALTEICFRVRSHASWG